MSEVSFVWVVVAFVVGILLAALIAWLLWQRRAGELEQQAREVRADLDGRIRLLQQQEVTIDQLEGRVREGEIRRRDLEEQLAECHAVLDRVQPQSTSAEAPDVELRTPDVAEVLEVEASEPDDLKRVEGIGPKIASLLNEAGILTFADLAATEVERLALILQQARIRLADPTTWPEQAALAAEGKWEQLEALQDRLKGGRAT